MANFADFGLCRPILNALTHEQHVNPTPIQSQTIPIVLSGRDVLGVAQTGTGKTAAFALPILHRLAEAPRAPLARTCRALVLAPTRELAAQILERFEAYGSELRFRSALVIGGVAMGRQIKALASGLDVLVATPGRLVDLMEQRAVDLSAVETLVLDEVDQMLDLGFIHAIRRIAGKLPAKRQSLFFSATLPPPITALADKLLADPLKVVAKAVGSTPDRIDQQVAFVDSKEKPGALAAILSRPELTRALVFTRTKRGADRVVRDLDKRGIEAGALHGNKSQPQRERIMAAFRAGTMPVLVATDIAARGIDIDDISHVVNYDLPNVAETYVHRIGRTARAGAAGVAIALCNSEERPYLRDIEKLMKRPVTRVELDRGSREAASLRAAPRARAAGDDARPEKRQNGGKPGRKAAGPRRPAPAAEPRETAARRQKGTRASTLTTVPSGGSPTGTVKFFNGKKGFGFIARDGGGADIFVHVRELSGLSGLKEGQRVAFETRMDEQRGKPSAVNVRVA
ncbi:MAG: DEAD/DEAH box helicase [Bauldia sp.]